MTKTTKKKLSKGVTKKACNICDAQKVVIENLHQRIGNLENVLAFYGNNGNHTIHSVLVNPKDKSLMGLKQAIYVDGGVRAREVLLAGK